KTKYPHQQSSARCKQSLEATHLDDAQRTISLTRLHAAEWHVDPRKIGVIGFSAGGHLVAASRGHFDKRVSPPEPGRRGRRRGASPLLLCRAKAGRSSSRNAPIRKGGPCLRLAAHQAS